MFIPVSVGSGTVTQSFIPALSGTLVAECRIQYEGVWYSAGEEVQIRREHEVTLSLVADTDVDVILLLDGVEFIWYVRKPTELATVENGGFHGLVGEYTELTVGDRVLTLQEGEGSPDLFIPDYGNELLMVVDLQTGNFKKLETPGLISVDILPGLQADHVPFTVGYVVREGDGQCQFVGTDNELNEIFREGFPEIAGGIPVRVSAVRGEYWFVHGGGTSFYEYSRLGVRFTQTQGSSIIGMFRAGPYFVEVTKVGLTAFYYQSRTNMFQVTLPRVTASSLFSADSRDNRIAIIDRTSGMLHEGDIETKTFRSYYVGDEGAISSLLMADEGVLLGFFDNGIRRYVDGQFVEQVSEAGTSFMVQGDELIATRLHATDIVYNVVQKVTTVEPREVNRNTNTSVTINHVAEIGGPAALINALGTVTVNGEPFDGFLPAECTLVFIMPGTPQYHQFRKMGVVGPSAYVWDVVTQPNLNINPVTLPPRYDAQIRTYEIEQIEISGITEGYFEELYVTNPNVQMRVNGGEWGDRVSVTTHDTVEIRWYLERYSTKYDPNIEIRLARNNALLGSWYVLKMELDGVEVEKRHSENFQHKDLFIDDRSTQTVKADIRLEGDGVVLPIVADREFYSAGKAHVLGESAKAAMIASAQVYGSCKASTQIGCSEYTTQLHGVVAVTSRVIGEIPLTSGVDRRKFFTVNSLASDVSSGLTTSVFEQVVEMGSATPLREVQSTAADTSGGAEIVAVKFDTALERKYGKSLYAGRFGEVASGVSYEYVYIDNSFRNSYRELNYGRDAEFKYRLNTYAIDSAYLREFAGEQAYFDVGLSVRHRYRLMKVAIGVEKGKAITYIEVPANIYSEVSPHRVFGVGSDFVHGNIFRTFTVTAGTVKYRIVEFSIGFHGYNITVFNEFNLNVEARMAVTLRVFDVSGALGSSANYREAAVEPVIGSSALTAQVETMGSILQAATCREVVAVVKFRTSQFREIAVEDARFTQEEAEQEYDLYSEGSIPEIVEVDGSYIVRTLPQLEDPNCKPEDAIDSKRKSFGYLGGG